MKPSELILVKWGGSLITDKSRPGVARQDVIDRLAAETAAQAGEWGGRLILGHGSGSFGHAAADRVGLTRGAVPAGSAPGVAATQAEAARLHHMVIRALAAAGLAPFSIVPGSAMVAVAGRAATVGIEPLELALDLGLLPVVYGDVVLDRDWGATVLSTEAVFLAAATELGAGGRGVTKAFWLGETDGIYDAAGKTVARITASSAAELDQAVTGSAGIDVTGGMRHRLASALALAKLGVSSWILDGRREGVLTAALTGEPVGGSRVVAEG